MSIRLRLSALFTLATIVLIGAGGVGYLRQLRSGLENSLNASLTARADTIGTALGTSLPARLPDRLSGYAQAYARDGRLLDTSAALAGDRLLTVAEVVSTVAGDAGPIFVDRKVYLHTEDDPGPEALRVYGARTGRTDIVVAVADSRDLVDNAVTQARHQMIIFGGIAIVIAGIGSWLLARAALRPVERMRAHVAHLDASATDVGVPVPGTRDEIARLGRTFNGLLGRLHSALARERAFVADAGHELRSPLTVLKGELELAQRPGRSRRDLLDTIGVASEETDRLARLTENLLVLARETRAIPLGPVDLSDIARAATTNAAALAAARDVTLTVHDQSTGVVDGDADRLRQAIDNLLTNAIRYSPAGGTVRVQLARDDANAVIEVADEGPGFPPEFLPHAFERFARADDARARAEGGNGLGLAIVAAVMAAHGGTAAAANRPGSGAVLTLRWPHTAPHRDTPARAADPIG